MHRPEEDNNELKEKNLTNSFIFNKKNKINFSHLNSKFSFHLDKVPVNSKISIRQSLNIKNERKIILTIIKSNVSLSVINRHFIITERGIDCSQKTHSTDYISVGRQQVNDQGVRPNDIMLFPTDPSISRSHFKIYHKDYFHKLKDFDSKFFSMMKLTHPKNELKKILPNFNSEVVFNIMKYVYPGKKVAVEDNGTIYGTYVRIKGYSYLNFLNNFLLTLVKTQNRDCFQDNFNLRQTLQIFENFQKEDFKIFKSDNLLIQNLLRFEESLKIKQGKNPFDIFSQYSTDLKMKTALSRNSLLNEKDVLKENNFIVDDYVPAVFLNNSKLGFIIIQTGGINKIIEAMKNEGYEFNDENINQIIDLVSLDKIFSFQKMDCSSQIYKATVTKEEFISVLENYPEIYDYSILFFIETAGDPCGVMNRVNDVLFFIHKEGVTENKRSFSFNYIKGFLIGGNPKSSVNVHMNCDTDSFLYYNSSLSKWIITDLTKFLNPNVYYSEEYHGLWVGTSYDKKFSNRFTPKRHYVQSEDEIKVSETVMKLMIEDDNK